MKPTKLLLFLSLITGITVCLWPTYPKLDVLKASTVYKDVLIDKQYIIYIDYSLPFYKKRLYVIDLNTKEIILNAHVSHAWKSGFLRPKKFSNTIGSRISSKGVFKTQNHYTSNHGYGKYKIGMRIKGLEKGKNDNALQRNIVFHSSFGIWSSGCYMTLPWVNKKIIELTANNGIVIVK